MAITGFGLVTCGGRLTADVWSYVEQGRCSGTRPIDRFQVERYPTRVAALVNGFDAAACFDDRTTQEADRSAHLALHAVDSAMSAAKLPAGDVDPNLIGVTVGTAFGSIDTFVREARFAFENPGVRLSPFVVPRLMTSSTAFHIAKRIGAHGPNQTFSTACSSGSLAIGAAARVIERGDADIMIACGTDAPVVEPVFRAWIALKVMTTRNDDPERAFKPFDADRDGFVMGEGAAALVCEELHHARKRGATIYGEIAGFGSTCDAMKLTTPSAAHQASAMRGAMRDAGVTPADLAFVGAHGTATRLNDVTETAAIREVLGPDAEHVPVTCSKPLFGHTMGASGAIEFIVGLLAMQHGRVPAVPNLSRRDPACALPFVGAETVTRRAHHFMMNSFGFGGNNVVLIGHAPPGTTGA